MITSLKNPRLKNAIQLRERRSRRREGLFIVEGAREIDRALRSGAWRLDQLFFCQPLLTGQSRVLLEQIDSKLVIEVSKIAFEKLIVRLQSGGVLAVFEQKAHPLSKLVSIEAKDLFIVVENIEKPGNLGAILRTADAVGAAGIILVGAVVDMYSPNVIRSSMGAFFSVPIYVSTFREFSDWCSKNNIHLFTTYPGKAVRYTDIEYSSPCALCFGSESGGLTEAWSQLKMTPISIPMLGISDSLNLSVAVAVVCYEVLRQGSLK